MKRLTLISAAGLAAIVAGCGGGSSDQSASIGAQIGGTCTSTDYWITNKIDNSKTPIYDCTRNGKEMCVTQQNGVTHDSTVIVRLLFQGALSGKPACI